MHFKIKSFPPDSTYAIAISDEKFSAPAIARSLALLNESKKRPGSLLLVPAAQNDRQQEQNNNACAEDCANCEPGYE